MRGGGYGHLAGTVGGAVTGGVNQALVFYHFGSVDELLVAAYELLVAACTTATAARVEVFPRAFRRGIELYEGADPRGAASALDALDHLGAVLEAFDGLGPVATRAPRAKVRRTTR
jgi:AcrR family transcriptional regulator